MGVRKDDRLYMKGMEKQYGRRKPIKIRKG
jgi:hypothetical protein